MHEDTRFEPLVIAFEAVKRDDEPFVEEDTKNGKKLLLHADLKNSKSDYFYVYWINPAKAKKLSSAAGSQTERR